MIEPLVAPSANERGFAISRLISHWHDIVGDTAAWCRPADIHFPRGSRNNGTLKLQITSGRGPQAQAMSAQIKGEIHLVLFQHGAIIIQGEKRGNARF